MKVTDMQVTQFALLFTASAPTEAETASALNEAEAETGTDKLRCRWLASQALQAGRTSLSFLCCFIGECTARYVVLNNML